MNALWVLLVLFGIGVTVVALFFVAKHIGNDGKVGLTVPLPGHESVKVEGASTVVVIILVGVGIIVFSAWNLTHSYNPFRGYSDRQGAYIGTTTNKTLGVSGSTSLNIEKIDESNGSVTASINWGQGLNGKGNLYGQVSSSNPDSMKLNGDIYVYSDSSQTNYYITDGELNCTFTSQNQLQCSYTLSPRLGNTFGQQKGDMQLTKQA